VKRGFLLLLYGGLLAIAEPAIAHKLQYSLTDMLWRPDRGVLEIEHAIHLDDAMTLLAHLGDPQGHLPPKTQAKLLHYVDSRFVLVAADTIYTLEAVGAKIEGDYLWIYQELEISNLPAAIQVTCEVMQDLFPRQTNQVNLRVGENVRTLHFNREQKLAAFTGLR